MTWASPPRPCSDTWAAMPRQSPDWRFGRAFNSIHLARQLLRWRLAGLPRFNTARFLQETFMSASKLAVAMAILFCATACGDTWGQRAVTGGAIGAGSGA